MCGFIVIICDDSFFLIFLKHVCVSSSCCLLLSLSIPTLLTPFPLTPPLVYPLSPPLIYPVSPSTRPHLSPANFPSNHQLVSVSDVVEDYHTLQTAREEKFNSAFRKHLKNSGVPVENSKGEAGIGQHELNVRFTDILGMCDRHIVYKQCLKEVADQLECSVTFMAKPFHDTTGSGCHIHISLHNPDGSNAFAGSDKFGPVNCSPLFRQFLAGLLNYTNDVMPFFAPTVNSYKRFVSSSWVSIYIYIYSYLFFYSSPTFFCPLLFPPLPFVTCICLFLTSFPLLDRLLLVSPGVMITVPLATVS